MKVLAIVAHPDDEILGVGGTLAAHVDAGDEVTALIVSEGASSRYADGADQTLRSSAERAAAVLGLRAVDSLGLPDQRLDAGPILDVIRPIEQRVGAIAPDVVYTHHWGDLNRDHQVVFEAVLVACRAVPGQRVRRLLCFETPSSSEWGAPDPRSAFVPNWFRDISATLARKLDAMRCYETEVRPMPHPRAIESLDARARYWGQTVGVTAAEPFVCVRNVE